MKVSNGLGLATSLLVLSPALAQADTAATVPAATAPAAGVPAAVSTPGGVAATGAGVVHGPPATGLALELRLGTALTAIGEDGALPGTSGGLFVGYRGRAPTIGVGFDLVRMASSYSSNTFDEEQAVTIAYVLPGVRAVLARSDGGATELLGQLDLGYGATFIGRSNSEVPPGVEEPTYRRIRGQLGPGVLHWLTPGFAIGAGAGVRYDRQSRSRDTEFDTSTSAFAVTSLFASLQMTGVF